MISERLCATETSLCKQHIYKLRTLRSQLQIKVAQTNHRAGSTNSELKLKQSCNASDYRLLYKYITTVGSFMTALAILNSHRHS